MASTPPSSLYTCKSVYVVAQDRIFSRSWQFVAHENDVRVPGQTYPFTLLEGCLDEPLLLVRDREDQLRCMSNVCTHRGMKICEQGGVESSLRCRYHGRRFKLDGSFESMPEFDQAQNFPSDADDLKKVQIKQWGPFIFVSLNPVVSFDDWIGPIRQRMNWVDLSLYKFDASLSRDYLVSANWALYCENYQEGFHIPFVHASLNEVVDYGSYTTELFDHGNLQLGLVCGRDGCFDLPSTSTDSGKSIGGYYYWLFPNLMLNFYPWGLSINIVKPLGVDRTRVSFLTYVCDATKLEQGAGAGLDRVEREDEAIVELVQQGVRSRLYDRGRYSPTREQGTHHFHRMLANHLKE